MRDEYQHGLVIGVGKTDREDASRAVALYALGAYNVPAFVRGIEDEEETRTSALSTLRQILESAETDTPLEHDLNVVLARRVQLEIDRRMRG